MSTEPNRWADWGEAVDADGVPTFPDPPPDLLQRFLAEDREHGSQLIDAEVMPSAAIEPLTEILLLVQQRLLPMLRKDNLLEPYDELVMAVDDIVWNPAFGPAVERACERGFVWDRGFD